MAVVKTPIRNKNRSASQVFPKKQKKRKAYPALQIFIQYFKKVHGKNSFEEMSENNFVILPMQNYIKTFKHR